MTLRPSNPARAAAALLAGLLMAGCVAGPDFEPPAVPPAERYTAERLRAETMPAAAASADPVQHLALGQEVEGRWWSLFRSDAIGRVVSDALTHNRSLAASTATLAEARDLAAAANGGRYPQVGLTAGVGRQKYGKEFLGGLVNLPPFTYYAIGPAISYALDTSGGIARTVEQRNALAEVARQQLDAAYLEVTGEAVMQTLTIAAVRAQIATAETVLDQDRRNLTLVETAFAEGSVPRADVVSARSQLAADTTLLPPLRQALARSRHALSVVLGRTPADALPADLELADITLPRELPVSLPSELAHRRPDILAAEARLHAATSAVGIAAANLYPKIQLTASASLQSLTPGALFEGASGAWSLIAGVTQPLFDGGTLRAEKRAAADAMRASAATYQQTVLQAFAQVADLLEALDHDAEQLDAQREAQDAARANLDLARASYAAGNAGVLQVLDAERLFQQGQLGYVRALAQRYLDTVQLFLALGGAPPDRSRSSG
jgi:NodT family efflux transporter outer membrane factor (OMF) lipoprotein